jgi:hypothetical protein
VSVSVSAHGVLVLLALRAVIAIAPVSGFLRGLLFAQSAAGPERLRSEDEVLFREFYLRVGAENRWTKSRVK